MNVPLLFCEGVSISVFIDFYNKHLISFLDNREKDNH